MVTFDRGWAEFRTGYPAGPGYWWHITPLDSDATEPQHVTHAWEAKRAIARAAEERGWTPKAAARRA